MTESVYLIRERDGLIIYANPSFERLFGYRPGEMPSQHVSVVNAPTVIGPHEIAREIMSQLTRTGTWIGEVLNRKKDGTVFLSWANVSMFEDEQHGRVLVSFHQDITQKKEKEAAFRAREHRFRALLESSWDSIALFDSQGDILYGSPSTRRVLGYGIDEFLTKNAFDLIHPDDRETVGLQLAESVEKPGTAVPVSARVRHREGAWRTLEGVFTNLLDDPHVGGIVNNYRDVTERLEADEALQVSRAELQTLLEYVPVVVYKARGDDSSASTTFVSAHVHELLGFTADEWTADPGIWVKSIHPDDRQRVLREIDELRAAGGHSQIEYRLIARDGSEVWVLDEVRMSRDPLTGELAFFGALTDITAAKAAARRLSKAETMYHELFETMAQGVVYQDSTGRITKSNAAAERILGLTVDQLLGRTSHDPRWRAVKEDGEDFSGQDHPSMVSLRTAEPVPNTLMGVFHPGLEEWRWLQVHARPRLGPDGEVTSVYTTFEDVTDWRRATDELKKEIARRQVAETKLRSLAFTDELTGLPNRRGLAIVAGPLLKLARRKSLQVAIVFADTDGLKEINDSYGHAEGDRAIVGTATTLKAAFRGADVVARVGGDEFVVLMLVSSDVDVVSVSETRLALALAELNARADHEWQLSMTFGVACDFGASDPLDLDELISKADSAMYNAKGQSGRR